MLVAVALAELDRKLLLAVVKPLLVAALELPLAVLKPLLLAELERKLLLCALPVAPVLDDGDAADADELGAVVVDGSGFPSVTGVGEVDDAGGTEDEEPGALLPLGGVLSARGSAEEDGVAEPLDGCVEPLGLELPPGGGTTGFCDVGSVGRGVPSLSGAFGSVGVLGGVSEIFAARKLCSAAR